MKTQNTLLISELPAFIASVLMDEYSVYHYLFKRFMYEANKAYLLLVEHGSIASIPESDYQEFKLLRSRLSGFETAASYFVMDELVSPCVRDAFQLVLDILHEDFQKYSACFVAPSPDSAVLENVTVEVTQGATYSQALCVHCIEQGHDNLLIDVQAFTSPYPQCVGCVYQGVPVQPTDSFFNPLPLSAYFELVVNRFLPSVFTFCQPPRLSGFYFPLVCSCEIEECLYGECCQSYRVGG